MESQFQAAGTIKIDDRRFTIYGRILNGEIVAQQYAKIPLGDDSEISLQIDSVEFMDRIREKISLIALVFNQLDSSIIEMIESAGLQNKTVLISDSTELMNAEAVEWYSPDDPTPRHQCPCCDYISLPERGNYLICPICYWEDDGLDLDALNEPSGPNHGMTLREGRRNFLALGACDKNMLQNVIEIGERSRFEHQPRIAE